MILKTENVKKYFFKSGGKIEVLKGVNFSCKKGEFISVVGASGAGKSTLLHILGGLDYPSEGEVFFKEDSVYRKKQESIAKFRNKAVGFIFQFHHLLPEFSAIENLIFPMLISGVPKDKALKKGMEVLDEISLSHRADHKPGELSGGEQQRVAIGRALINNPEVLLADEPTGNLDSKTGESIFETLMEERRKRQMTLIMLTHNEDLAKRAGSQIRLKDGTVNYI